MDAADNLTTAELKKEQWSGIRYNYPTGRLELWIAGDIHADLSIMAVRENPALLATAFENVFGLRGHVIQMDMPTVYHGKPH